MTYRLAPTEPVANAVQRIAREEAAGAAQRLRNSAGNRDEAVHEARKSVKKLRALLRLVRSQLGSVASEENQRLRDAGRKLSALRDAAAMLEVMDDFEKRFASGMKGLDGIRGRLIARRQEAENRTDAGEILEAAAAALDSTARSAGNWSLEADGFSALEKGFVSAFRAGRKALARVRKRPEDENYHEWRKRVKDHWYHVRLLGGVLGKDVERREKQLEILSEWLGDDHNIVVLRAMLRAESRALGARRDIHAFLDVLQKRQAQLREKALKKGERLYAPKPRKVAQRFERCWNAGKARAEAVPARKPPASDRDVAAAATSVA
jgi:CHAD domain-containing protein